MRPRGRSSRGEAMLESERDIVSALAREGRDMPDCPVGKIMTRRVVTCAPSDRIDDPMARMTDGRMRHLPVPDGAEPVGIVPIGDIVKARMNGIEAAAQALKDDIPTG